jgi:hypothetical protein
MTYSAIIQELQQIKVSLASVKPVKLESRIQWTGLIGAAQDIWADRKAKKLCTTQIINDTDYLNVPSLLTKRAKELEEYLSVTTDVNESIKAVALIQECYKIWNTICPEIAYWTVNEECWNDCSLPICLVIEHKLCNSFRKYNLPEELRNEIEVEMKYVFTQIENIINPKQNNTSGCLGIFLFMIVPTTALYFFLV